MHFNVFENIRKISMFTLREPDTPGRGSAILYKGDNLCDFLFAFSAHQISYWKGVNAKRRELVSKGNKFFPLKVDPFSAWSKLF